MSMSEDGGEVTAPKLSVAPSSVAPSSVTIVVGNSSAVKNRNATYASSNPITSATPNLMRDCNNNCDVFSASASN